MRCRLWTDFIQPHAHRLGLVLRPLPYRTPSSNRSVLFLDFRSPAFGDQGTEVFLKSPKGDQVAVGEEPGEEVVHFCDLRGTAHVHEHYGGAFAV